MNEASNIAQLESDLELDSGDQDTRVILADLYESIGDPIAETLRWMVENSKRPCLTGKGFGWSFAFHRFPSGLPKDVINRFKPLKLFGSCKEATIALHDALTGNTVAD